MRYLLFTFFLIHLNRLLSCVRGKDQINTKEVNKNRKRVAIIGGGISGTFASKYMAEYDSQCEIESLTIFEPYCIQNCDQFKQTSTSAVVTPQTALSNANKLGQGSRVANVKLSDDTVVEIGASVVYSGNKLVVDMIQESPELIQAQPFHPARNQKKMEGGQTNPSGLGIYKGDQKWFTITSNWLGKAKVFWRYQLDLLKVRKEADKMLEAFDVIYKILESKTSDSFLQSPTEIWKAVGLYNATLVSFDKYLDSLGVSTKEHFFNQGYFRDELLMAMNLCNNNQDNEQMNGLAGMVNFVSSKGPLFSVLGGNHQLVQSAFKRAKLIYTENKSCRRDNDIISHIPSKVSKVIYDQKKGIDIISFDEKKGETNMGTFDVVILAAPMQFSGITFLEKQSSTNNDDNDDAFKEIQIDQFFRKRSMKNHHGVNENRKSTLPTSVPTALLTTPYTQVITTVISNATWNHSLFGTDPLLPTKSFLMTKKGRKELGISSVSKLTIDGVYKVFSSTSLPMKKLQSWFGPHVKLEYSKSWGGPNGGATPSFGGGSDPSVTLDFLLYAGEETSNNSANPAIFYTNGMESAVAAIEISAIGAKAVAKLVSNRLGLVSKPHESFEQEL